MMDPPIKLFGQTIAKPAASSFTSASGETDGVDAAPTTSTGGWGDLPSSSQAQDVKENSLAESSDLGETSGGGGKLYSRQDLKMGSVPDLTSSTSNSLEQEKLCVSPRGGGGAEVNRSMLSTPPASAGDGEDDNSEEEDGSGSLNGRSKKGGGDGSGGEEIGKGGEKMPRRPDKAVACPRCHSLETKFCYYNNYNVNQPRHFCKHCQRYWTAGGTLRNVPVGAGRRKNKHGSTIAPRGQAQEVGTVRSDPPDIASPSIVTKGVVPVPMQVSVVQAGGGKAGVMRMTVPAASDQSAVMPFFRIHPQQMDTAGIFMTSSDTPTSSDTATVVGAKRGRIVTSGYSDVSTGANDMDQSWQQHQSTKDESASSQVTTPNNNNSSSSSNMIAGSLEIKGESGAGTCPGDFSKAVGSGSSPGAGYPDRQQPQQQHATNNNVAGGWNGAGPAGSVNSGAYGAPPGAGGPYGFYNGGWPYGYSVGWSGPPSFCGPGVGAPGSNGVGVPPPLPPGSVPAWNSAAGSVWTGVPWPMPGMAWGGPPWAMAPWAMSAGPGGASLGMTQTIPTSSGVLTVPVPCPTVGGGGVPPSVVTTGPPPSSLNSSLGKHSRGPPTGGVAGGGNPGNGRMEGALWAPKSLRMADPEEAMRSSVWRILGVGTRPDMTTASTFKAFQPRSESKKVSDDEQQAVQASLHANPAAMSRSMIFHESN